MAERFVQWIHDDPTFTWDYASWIEPLGPDESEEGIQSTKVGQYPGFEVWKKQNGT